MALQLLALTPWLIIGLLGIVVLVTGRPIYGLPVGIREGWPSRLFGLVYSLAAAYYVFRAIQDPNRPDVIVISYIILAAFVYMALVRRRKQRAGGSVGPRP